MRTKSTRISSIDALKPPASLPAVLVCGLRCGSRATSSQTTPATSVSAANIATVSRQLLSNSGMNTLFADENANAVPMNGPVIYRPTAVPRSFGPNHCAIIFGAPTDISGPPTPKIATARNSETKSTATARANPDSATRKTPAAKPARVPNRSSTVPEGTAAAM